MSLKHIVFDYDGTLIESIIDRQVPYKGIVELLEKLRSAGVKLYVWTSANRQLTLQSLRSLKLLEFFEGISTSNDATPKPSADGLELMLSDIDSHEICVIGDNPSDIVGGKKIKATVFGANWKFQSEGQAKILKSYGADDVFDEVEKLEKVLMSLLENKNV